MIKGYLLISLSKAQRAAPGSSMWILALTVLTFALAVQTAQADSWNTKANASVSWNYNDNPTLRPADSPLKREATSYGRARATAVLEYATPNLAIEIAPRVTRSFYPNKEDKDLESTNIYLDTFTEYSLQRNSLDLLFEYSHVGLLTDEFGDGSADDPGTGAPGANLRVDDTVQRYDISPQWTHQLGENNQVSVGMVFFGSDYKLEKTNRADNQNKQVQISYNHNLNNRMSFGISVLGRRFESEKLAPIPVIDINLKNSSDSVGATIDLNYVWSERTNIGLNIGRTSTNSKRDILLSVDPMTPVRSTSESDITNTIFNFIFNHSGYRNTFNIIFSRGIVPSSLGIENTQTSISVSARRRLSERLTAVLSFNGFDQESINNQQRSFSNKYRFLTGNASLAWRFNRSWATSGIYTYRQNSNGAGSNSQRADSSQLGITLTYLWD